MGGCTFVLDVSRVMADVKIASLASYMDRKTGVPHVMRININNVGHERSMKESEKGCSLDQPLYKWNWSSGHVPDLARCVRRERSRS
jgi:hypothetical protein